MSVTKVTASSLNNTEIYEGLGKFSLPTFCDLENSLAKNSANNNNGFFNWNDLNNCTNKIITVQVDLNRKFTNY